MAKFSERHGLVPRAALQVDEMTDHYRTDLWNSTYLYLVNASDSTTADEADAVALEVMHIRFDEIPTRNTELISMIGRWWSRARWHEVYDAIETILEEAGDDENLSYYLDNLKTDFVKNLAPVRVVAKEIVKVDADSDVEAIEGARDDTKDLDGARHHLERALSLLSDRDSPDYPNSIKESISAVEAVVKHITGKPGATLGSALDRLQANGVTLHRSLISGWKSIYGYTSDAEGIRHSASERPRVNQDEARYWLVTCSAFVSLVLKLHEEREKQ